MRKILTALILSEDIDSFIAASPPGGVSIVFQGTGKTIGVCLYPAIGGLRFKTKRVI